MTDTGNNRVEEFTSSGTFIQTFGWGVKDGASSFEVCTASSSCQAGIQGSGNGQFKSPTGIAVDSAGNIYIADQGNNRIEKFSPECTLASSSPIQIQATQINKLPGGLISAMLPTIVYMPTFLKASTEKGK